MKNTFYFMLKALFVLEISRFLSSLFGYAEKRLDKMVKVNFKNYDVIGWKTSNYKARIAQYLKN